MRILRFVLGNVLAKDLKLLGRRWDQVRLFYERVERVEDLRYKRLAGVITIDSGYRNVGFTERCYEVAHSDSCDLMENGWWTR